MHILFDNYLSWMLTEVGKILEEAVSNSKDIPRNWKKLNTLHDAYHAGQDAAGRKIEELKYGSIWAWISGGNTVNIEWQQRAINTLEVFIKCNILFFHGVGKTILKVKEYQSQTKQLQKTKPSPGPLKDYTRHFSQTDSGSSGTSNKVKRG